MCQGCNRREFMGVAAMGGALLASQLMRNSVFAAEGDPDWPPMPPAKIYRLFVGRTRRRLFDASHRRNREVQPVLYASSRRSSATCSSWAETWSHRPTWPRSRKRSRMPTDCSSCTCPATAAIRR